MLVDSKSLVV